MFLNPHNILSDSSIFTNTDQILNTLNITMLDILAIFTSKISYICLRIIYTLTYLLHDSYFLLDKITNAFHKVKNMILPEDVLISNVI